MSTAVCFTARGDPVGKGSKRLVRGRLIDVNQKKLRAWQGEVASAAMVARVQAGVRVMEGPVDVEIRFLLRRPQRPKHPDAPVGKRDVDKLVRAVLDGLTGSMYVDDGQVTDVVARKRWAPQGGEGAVISVRPRRDFRF